MRLVHRAWSRRTREVLVIVEIEDAGLFYEGGIRLPMVSGDVEGQGRGDVEGQGLSLVFCRLGISSGSRYVVSVGFARAARFEWFRYGRVGIAHR